MLQDMRQIRVGRAIKASQAARPLLITVTGEVKYSCKLYAIMPCQRVRTFAGHRRTDDISHSCEIRQNDFFCEAGADSSAPRWAARSVQRFGHRTASQPVSHDISR